MTGSPRRGRIRNFDIDALYAALDAERQARSLSWSGLRREVNALFRDVPCPPIATATITGMKGRPAVIGNAVLQMLVWLDRTPESFIPGFELSSDLAQVLPRLPANRMLRFDPPAIFRALDALRVERGMTWRQVAEEIGEVSVPNLTGLAKGQGVAFPAVGRMAQWLGRPVASLTVASEF